MISNNENWHDDEGQGHNRIDGADFMGTEWFGGSCRGCECVR